MAEWEEIIIKLMNGYLNYWANIIHATKNQIDECEDEQSRLKAQKELDDFMFKIIYK